MVASEGGGGLQGARAVFLSVGSVLYLDRGIGYTGYAFVKIDSTVCLRSVFPFT